MHTASETKEHRPYAQNLRWLMEEAMPTWGWDPQELTWTIVAIEAIVEDCPEALEVELPGGVQDMLVEEIRAIHENKGYHPTHILTIRNTLISQLALQEARCKAGGPIVQRLSQQTRSDMGFNPDDVLG